LKKSEKNGVIFADQWNNLDIARRITSRRAGNLDECAGRVDGFICAIGTGPAPSRASPIPARKKKDIVIGSPTRARGDVQSVRAWRGEASGGRIDHRGHRARRVTPIIADLKIDKPYLIPDEEAVPSFHLLEHEGLCPWRLLGHQCRRRHPIAKDLGPGHTIVTVLAMAAARYQSKLFNPASCARRSCRCRAGLSGNRISKRLSCRADPWRPIACFATTPI